MIISSKKYACETCIKGHRSSSCKHFDRPLFEIKKKGRPVTQCEHCRELRKTKQVHVKCICEGRSESPLAPKGAKPGFESATFPNGVPMQALETSVASEGVSSDSEMSGGNSVACQCKDAGACHCCVPRKAPRFRKPNVKVYMPEKTDLSVFGDPSRIQSNTAQILARIAELRPVLPRPSDPPTYDPNLAAHTAHQGRYHDNTFSPYERAYGMTHHQLYQPQASHYSGHDYDPTHSNAASQSSTPHPTHENFFPAVCACGDNCQCPGCSYHNNTIVSAESAFSTCTNPDNCATCLDCTILSLQNMLPLDTALSIPQPSTSDSVDEWLQNMASQTATTDAHYNDYSTPQQHPSSSSSMWAQGSGLAANSDLDYVPRMDFDYTTPSHHARSASHTSLGQASDLGMYADRRGVSIPFQRGVDYTRSRSVSTSSQSSRQDMHDRSIPASLQVPYRPSGRVQGSFTAGEILPASRSTPQLIGRRRGASIRVSPSPYASSNPDADLSPISPHHDSYNPSLEGLNIR